MSLLYDIRFGFRMLLKNPGFTAVAIMALALGIGVNSAVFTIYNAALLKSLPFDQPQQVVHIGNRSITDSKNRLGMSWDEFTQYRKQTHSFSGIAAIRELTLAISDEHGPPEQINGARISANTFSLLGQKTRLGRDFREEDETPDAEPVAILSYGLWQSRYGGDPSAIGSTLKRNGRVYTIVGVMREGMEFPEESRMWIPLVPNPDELKNRSPIFDLIARLREDTPLRQAQTELTGIGRNISREHPETNKNTEPYATSYIDWVMDSDDRMTLASLLGAVTFVLLIACANVANLLLSRAVHRSHETSIRVAIGASRWRIVRQLLIESILLSFAGGAAGLIFAIGSLKIFVKAVQPLGIPYYIDWSMDTTAFGYLLAVCFVAGVLFGLAPALQISKANVNEGLKESGRGSSGALRSRRLTSALVVVEISLTLVLMIGGGLLIRSLMKRQSLSLGIRTENLITAGIGLQQTKYPQPQDRIAFVDRLTERLGAMPDIQAFTIASHIPARGAQSHQFKLVDRNVADKNGVLPSVLTVVVTPGYFQALDLTIPRGREFRSGDGQAGSEAVIVNQRFVAQYWPGEEAIGKQIQLDSNVVWLTVVGISPTIRQNNARLEIDPTIYVPYRQMPTGSFSIMARSRSSKEVLAKGLRDQMRLIDPDLPLANIRTMQESIALQTLERRILAAMFSSFAVIALILSSVGIYAVTAYATSQRTQEIGVRVALGAEKRDVVWLILRAGLRQLLIGLPAGLAAAYGVSRVLGSMLFQVTPSDPMTFVFTAAVTAAVIVTACMLPAWRASRLNPVDALRTE